MGDTVPTYLSRDQEAQMGHREKENVAEGSGCSVRCLYWRHMSQETNMLRDVTFA